MPDIILNDRVAILSDTYVCLDGHLADDDLINISGIKAKDIMACNDYTENLHKSYGYLRTPEFS